MDLGRIDPDDPRLVRSNIAVAVGQVGFEEKGIARRHQIGGVVDGQFDGAQTGGKMTAAVRA